MYKIVPYKKVASIKHHLLYTVSVCALKNEASSLHFIAKPFINKYIYCLIFVSSFPLISFYAESHSSVSIEKQDKAAIMFYSFDQNGIYFLIKKLIVLRLLQRYHCVSNGKGGFLLLVDFYDRLEDTLKPHDLPP